MAPVKRKRAERGSVDSGENRPSPHRPNNSSLAQHGQDGSMGRGAYGGGNRRGNYGGNRRSSHRGRPDRRNSSEVNVIPNEASMPVSSGSVPTPTAKPVAPISQPVSQPSPVAAPVTMTSITTQTRPEILPYDYSHLTEDRIKSWSAHGKSEIIEIGKRAINNGNLLDLSALFQELIRATLDEKISASEAGSCVKLLLENSNSTGQLKDICDGPSIFLDNLSIMTDFETIDYAIPNLQRLLLSSEISTDAARIVLDAELLQKLNLTRDTFIRGGVRIATNLLYRQSNHNLLREETEGYSKLVTELFTTSCEQATSANVEETFERVKGLIGTFDLDVGRVLDVTLDVFATLLIRQFRFFVKLLRISSWWPRESGLYSRSPHDLVDKGLPRWALPGSPFWETTEEEEEEAKPHRERRDTEFWKRARKVGLDAFFELGGRHILDDEAKNLILTKNDETDLDFDTDRQWIETTGTVPPQGNRMAAQLLGFKLQFYASEARDPEDLFPPNLLYLSALLIKIGFISLRDLYPHLWPVDEEMPAVQEAKEKELAEKERTSRPGGAMNALMMAGALADDTVPTSVRSRDAVSGKATEAVATETEEKPKLPTPDNTKVGLLIHLLTIGAIPEALFILGRFPWLLEAFPELLDLIHRILHHSINKVFKASLVPGVLSLGCPPKKTVDIDQSSAPKGYVRRSDAIPRKLLKWPFPDKNDVHEANTYKFYWDEWADNIPQCQSVDDIFTLCGTLLNLSGVNIGKDAALLSKLYTIGNQSLANDKTSSNLDRWHDLLKRLLVPALSLTKANANLADDLYQMLRYYPLATRYAIFAEWNEGQISRLKPVQAAFRGTTAETKDTMKRISKDNLTTMAKVLAKITYSSPGAAFKVIISQIESYSNLIAVVVECARYFTDLGFDVLIWSLLSSLGGKNRDRTQSGNVLLTSHWLIALAKFSGLAFKRYSGLNPNAVLQYINDQLYQGNAGDLIILEQLIANMTGIISDWDFNDADFLAMTGGEKLRKQALIRLRDKRFESVKTAKRLMRSLLDTQLAAPLLISIAQHRQSAILTNAEDQAPIKELATRLDETQQILAQYLDLLRSNLTIEQFDEIIPDTADLMSSYGLETSLAFLIGRASFSQRIKLLDDAPIGLDRKDSSSSLPSKDNDGDVDMISAEVADDPMVQPASPVDESQNASADPWRLALDPLVAAVRTAVPESTWHFINTEFYVVFWQLALADIHLPLDSYSMENAQLSREIADVMKDRSDMSRQGIDRRDEKRKTLETIKDDLMNESREQLKRYEKVRGRLNKDKLTWFVIGEGVKPDFLHDALLEHCFLPRLLLSPMDSDYCFKIVKFLHNAATPNFRTLLLYSRIFRANRLRTLIFACTIREAQNLGRFLRQILSDLSRWHSNKALYEKEAFGPNRDLPGFAKKMGTDQKPEILLDYDEFRRWVYSSHKALNNALKGCLSSNEFMHIRNAITIVQTVAEVFPSVDFMGKSFQNTFLEISKREKGIRDDLSLTAAAVLPALAKQEKKWVMPQAFASNLGEAQSQSTTTDKKAASASQQDTSSRTVLKATAAEFKPGAEITSNGRSTPKRAVKLDVEDGEVDDAKSFAKPKVLEEGNAASVSGTNTSLESLSASDAQSDRAARDKIPSRANTPKPSSAQPHLPGQPSREDTRSVPANSGVLEKAPLGLPIKPDVPFPSRANNDRHPAPRPDDRRDDRRDVRNGISLRERGPRDPLPSDRRPVDPHVRDNGRYPERSGHEREREWDRRGPDLTREAREPRDTRDSRDSRDIRDGHAPRDGRDYRDRIGDPRHPELNGRLNRPDVSGPPTRPSANIEPTTSVNHERGAEIDPNKVPINPARAKMIQVTSDSPASDLTRSGKDDERTRPSSRPQSPRRSDRGGERVSDYPDGRRSDRGPSGRYSSSDNPEFGRGRHDYLPPDISRNDRGGPRGSERPYRDQSAFQSSNPPPRNINPDHGRLNDANYGRLENVTTTDVAPPPTSGQPSAPPSGPRGSSRGDWDNKGGRAPITPMPEPNTSQIRDRGPPIGPAVRASRQNGSNQLESSNSNAASGSSQAPTSSSTSQVPPPSAPGMNSRAPPKDDPPPLVGPSVHPDRVKAAADDPPNRQLPTALQTNMRSDYHTSPSMSGLAPSGPRNLSSPATNPAGPNGFNTPTGPSANDRTRTTRDRNQIAGIQGILQAPEPRIRGRGAARLGHDNNYSNPSTAHSAAPPDGRDPPGDVSRDDVLHPDRKDLIPSRGPTAPENSQSLSGRQEPPPPPRSVAHHRSSGRDSRRSSRSGSPMREGNQRGPPRDRDAFDDGSHRSRRSEGGRSRHPDGGRREDREGNTSRDGPPMPRNDNTNWGGADGPNGPLGPSQDRGGRSHEMRHSGAGGESRRDSQGMRDGGDGGSGRKRRGDDNAGMGGGDRGPGSGSGHHDKRPRR